MPQIVGDARAPTQGVPIGGGQPAQWKPLQLATKNHQQCHAQHKARNRIAHQYQQRCHQVKPRAGTHRFGHTQRHGHQITDEEGPQPEAHRHRQLLPDQCGDIAVLKKAFAQVKLRKLLEHLPEALWCRLVETVQCFSLFNAFGVYTLRAPITQATAFGATARAGLGLRQILLDRTTRHKLDDDKRQKQHPKQGGHHQEQAFQRVQQHTKIMRTGERRRAGPRREGPLGGQRPA